MEIIGKTTGGYIIKASADELARVAGFYCFEEHRQNKRRDLTVGDDVLVSAMYSRLQRIFESEGKLVAAQTTLRAVADLIGPITACVSYATATDDDKSSGESS